MRSPVSRLLTAAAASTLALGVTGGPASAVVGDSTSRAAVRTLVAPGVLDSPAALAFDTSGDLFVADSGHCRVVVLPSHSGTFDGLRLRAGRVATLIGGSCDGARSIGHPTGLAVDSGGDVFIAEATAQRVQVVRSGAHPSAVTVAGTGRPGDSAGGHGATQSDLDQPTSVALDASGDLFIADTANCLIRVLPAESTTRLGFAMAPGRLYDVAGTRVCGTAGRGGPAASAELWDPVAVAVDPAGDVLVADRGDQSVLVAPLRSGAFWGTPVAAGHLGVVVGGTGGYGPYLADGLSATGATAELNDPRGLAVATDGTLFVTDGFMHALRAVPAADGARFGGPVKAGDLYTVLGALPVSTSTGGGNGTRWVVAHAGSPSGIAVSPSGNPVVSDAATGTVRVVTTR